MLLGLLLTGCRTATVVNGCDVGEEACLPCEADTECGYGGNACTETVYCAHEDAPIAVIEIGCDAALEHRWPAEESCRCVGGKCEGEE